MTTDQQTNVLAVADVPRTELDALLSRFGLVLDLVADGESITGSYWGEPEAGIAAQHVYARSDTPIHSLLHEASHVVCMSGQRRASLHSDAGSGDLEEAAVCLLQIVLAEHLTGVGSARLMQDMDAWGYSFRLGRTRRWFEDDADDARAWLRGHGLLGPGDRATFALRA